MGDAMTDTTKRVDVERLAELLAKATTGPWETTAGPSTVSDIFSDGDWNICPPLGEAGPVCIAAGGENASLITEAINALPTLLQQVAELERQRDAYKAADESMQDAHRNALAKLAERDALVARLSETWMDENGTTWIPPTAYAYAMVCRARWLAVDRAEAAERARDESHQELQSAHDWFESQAKAISKACGSTWDLMQIREQRDRIAAFLTANGGG